MQTHRRSMFLYLCLIWDLGRRCPQSMLIDEGRGSSAKPGVPFQILPALRNEGGRKRRWRPRLRPHPPRSTDGRGGGGEKKKKMPFPFVRSLRPTGNRPADSGRRRPRGNSDAAGQHGNSYSLIIRVRTLPRAQKISGLKKYNHTFLKKV